MIGLGIAIGAVVTAAAIFAFLLWSFRGFLNM